MDPDKLALLRSIATVMIAAWLIQRIDRRGLPSSGTTTSLRSPLVLPILALIVTYLVATAASISPRISFFGESERPEGVLGLLSFVVIFAMVLSTLRTRRQLERLVFAIILASFPVAMYAIVQRCQLDPIVWSTEFGTRAGSTLGNPIFLSAYLIMVSYLTLGSIAAGWYAATHATERRARRAHVLTTACYAVIAITQLLALVASSSRGPIIGWLGGAFLTIVLLGSLMRRRALVFGAVGLASVGAALLIVVSLPFAPASALRSLPVMSTLAHNLGDSSLGDRVWMWEGNAKLFTRQQPLQFPDGTQDRLDFARLFVGYGPDSIFLTHTQFAPPDPYLLYAGRDIDRTHNRTWDILMTTGLAGLVVFQVLYFLAFLYGLRGLGLVPAAFDRNALAGLWFGLGLAGALAAIAFGQVKYVGLAIPAGNVVAIFAYLTWFAARAKESQMERAMPPADRILVLALVAGLFANYVESQLGIAVTAILVLWWVFAGILIVIATGALECGALVVSAARPARVRIPNRAKTGGVLSYGMIVAMVVSTCLFDLVTYSEGITNPVEILWRALTFNPVLGAPSVAVAVMLGAVLMIGLAVMGAVTVGDVTLESFGRCARRLVPAAAASIGLALLFAGALALQLGSLRQAPSPVVRLEDVPVLASQLVAVSDSYAIFLLFLVAIGAVVLTMESKNAPARFVGSAWSIAAIVPVVVVAGLWMGTVLLNPVHANVTFRLARQFGTLSDWNAAIVACQRALFLAPLEDSYYKALGLAYQSESLVTNSTAASSFSGNTQRYEILNTTPAQTAALNRLDLLYAAQTMLLRARELNPLLTAYTVELARFYKPEVPVDTPGKKQLADSVNTYYAEALRLSPNDVKIWNEWANFALAGMNDPALSLEKLNASLARNDKYGETYLHLGNVYAVKEDYGRAAEAYENAVKMQPQLAEAESKLGFVYYRQGRLADSAQAYRKYLELAPDAGNQWEAHKNLALLYEQMHDVPSALREAEQSSELAPANLRDQLVELVSRLKALQ